MRTVVFAFLLLTTPVSAQEFKAPRLEIRGQRTPTITEQIVRSKYWAIKPACEQQAKLLVKEAETPEQYQKRQVQEFLWCVVQEFVGDGLSVTLLNVPDTQTQTGS
jgi:hypothetical protein